MHIFLFLLALFLAPLAQAQSVQYTEPIADWVFKKNYRGKTKEIDHCLIQNRFDNGTTFILAKNTDNIYRLALQFPHENLVLQKSYSVDILIDDKKYATATALVASPSVLAIALPNNPAMIKKIGRGNTLTISGPKDMVQFALKGTAKAVTQLNGCNGKTTPPPAVSKKFDRLPLWLENILVNIKMTDIKTIQIDNNQNLPLDYAWVSPEIFGGVKMMPYDNTKQDSKDLVQNYINIIEQLCSGDFLAEPSASRKTNTTEFQPYDVVCSNDVGDTITSLLFGIEEKMITVFFFESNASGKSMEKRNALIKILTE